jgi:hypothetical protein
VPVEREGGLGAIVSRSCVEGTSLQNLRRAGGSVKQRTVAIGGRTGMTNVADAEGRWGIRRVWSRRGMVGRWVDRWWVDG